jgi:hypothetical protein
MEEDWCANVDVNTDYFNIDSFLLIKIRENSNNSLHTNNDERSWWSDNNKKKGGPKTTSQSAG